MPCARRVSIRSGDIPGIIDRVRDRVGGAGNFDLRKASVHVVQKPAGVTAMREAKRSDDLAMPVDCVGNRVQTAGSIEFCDLAVAQTDESVNGPTGIDIPSRDGAILTDAGAEGALVYVLPGIRSVKGNK